jgi:hypothetical protein
VQFIMLPMFMRKTMISIFVDFEPIIQIWVLGTLVFYKYMKFTGIFSTANQVDR